MQHYTFAVVVMDQGHAAGWRERLRAELGAAGVDVVGTDEAAELQMGEQRVGWARLDDLESVAEFPALAGWGAPDDRPWDGKPAGLLRWTHPMASGSQKRTIVAAIVRAARGAIWNRSLGELLEPFVTRRCTLVDLTDRYGLDEGDALVERTAGPYLQSLLGRVRAMLHGAGLDAEVDVEPEGTGNTLRLDPHLYRARRSATGELVADYDAPVPDDEVHGLLYELGDLEFTGLDRNLGDDVFWDD